MKLKRLRDQVVVVMGAATGIGRFTALELAHRGASVVVAAPDGPSIEALAAEIQGDGGKALAVVADISKPEDVNRVAAAAESLGGLDTWINVAAVSEYAPFEQVTPEEWQRIVAVNLLGYAYGARAALPLLRQRGGGAIINISSVEGRVSLPLHSAYAASKHGIIGMADALRLELEHDKVPISVTTIMPASINTPFFEHAASKLGVKPRPYPPVYQPEAVVGAILYAAEHPMRDMVVGGAGRLMIALRTLAPGLSDWLLSRTGYPLQATKQPRAVEGVAATASAPSGDARIKEREAASLGRVRKPGVFSRHPGATAAAALGLLIWAWRSRRGL